MGVREWWMAGRYNNCRCPELALRRLLCLDTRNFATLLHLLMPLLTPLLMPLLMPPAAPALPPLPPPTMQMWTA